MTDSLAVQDLRVALDGQEILHGVNLHVPTGEIHALLGPNGCGKTTLMMTIMGYPHCQVTGGSISLDGTDITGLDITQRARLGLTMAHQRPPTMTGVTLRNVFSYLFSHDPEGVVRGDALASAYLVEPFLDRSINAGLSGGEIKRSELIQMLAMRPRFALLDEPDSGIDFESLALIGQMVHALVAPDPVSSNRRAALLVTHSGQILNAVSVDVAHVMIAGRIVCSGAPAPMLDLIRRDGFKMCATVFGRSNKDLAQNGNGLPGNG